MTGQLADLRLGQAGFPERGTNSELFGRLGAGTEIQQVIMVRPVQNKGDPLFPRDRGQCAKELFLALVASLRRIA